LILGGYIAITCLLLVNLDSKILKENLPARLLKVIVLPKSSPNKLSVVSQSEESNFALYVIC
jgi:hypothetical protein